MVIIFYFLMLVLSIMGAIHFYKKREGGWLTLAVFNIAIYLHFILTFLAETN